ncbi:hypothetical protein ACL02T_15335 [Pseudonocardia sp. RS010]|uniref:hypothetical protein n=1 Tax=Pseudonocardia sp. RS010 TaxID=3385979 RepID=UPI00399FA7F4
MTTLQDETRVEPGTDRWAELIEIGDRAMRSNWDLGDAALEIAPMGSDTSNNGAMDNLRRYADEIGCAWESIDVYRKVAAAWPLPRRLGCPWSVHQVLMAHPHLIRDAMTVRLEHEADRLSEEWESNRWATAEAIHLELTEGGKTVRGLAAEIGRSDTHVTFMAKAWRAYLGKQPDDRPPFNQAYQAAKQGKPKPDPAPEPDDEF